MIPRSALMFAISCSLSLAAVRSGHAEADWLTVSLTTEAGQPLQTGLRLVVDKDWHTYWENPGEGGMKLSVKWELPPGWTAGEVEHPVPKRFMTGELAGFGYEGAVIFPVAFTPPAEFSGTAKLKGKISWLTCNDNACVPGSANLELDVKAGTPTPAAEAGLIEAALKLVPRANPKIALSVEEKPETLILTLQKADSFELSDYQVFPATPGVIDPAAKIDFKSSAEVFKAEVPKSEYASGPIKELTLVLAGKSPFSVTWKLPVGKTN